MKGESVMSSKQFSQKQKFIILKKAEEIGFKEAADVAGVHFTTIYDWQRKYKGLGEKAFLAYKPSYPGRGIKEITPQQEKAVMDIWNNYPGFGPGQILHGFFISGKMRGSEKTLNPVCRHLSSKAIISRVIFPFARSILNRGGTWV